MSFTYKSGSRLPDVLLAAKQHARQFGLATFSFQGVMISVSPNSNLALLWCDFHEAFVTEDTQKIGPREEQLDAPPDLPHFTDSWSKAARQHAAVSLARLYR